MSTSVENSTAASQPTTRANGTTRVLRPRVDVYETEAAYVLRAELPGVNEGSAHVAIENDVLTVGGTVESTVNEGFRPLLGGFGPRRYERAFQVSDRIDRENLSAEMKDGVLTVTVPKLQRRTQITVRRG